MKYQSRTHRCSTEYTGYYIFITKHILLGCVHISVTKWSNVGYLYNELGYLWDGPIMTEGMYNMFERHGFQSIFQVWSTVAAALDICFHKIFESFIVSNQTLFVFLFLGYGYNVMRFKKI